MKTKLFKPLLLASLMILTASCGVQSIPQSKNAVESALAEINNQYKRRADLIPNLVNTVKGFAKQEETVLTQVTEARAKATSVTIDPTKMSAQKLAEFQAAQGSLSQALGRLMVVSENYPQLKSDANFRDLQAQLEGTENRITVARGRYIEAVKNFNDLVSVPPTSWTNSVFYKHEKLPQWAVEAEEQKKNEAAPAVNF